VSLLLLITYQNIKYIHLEKLDKELRGLSLLKIIEYANKVPMKH